MQYRHIITAICVMLFLGCANQQEQTPRTASDIDDNTVVAVGRLDDSGNPYKDQYESWDHWFYAHTQTLPAAFENGEVPENWTVLSARVNADGYLLPIVDKTRLYHEAIKAGRTHDYSEFPFRIQAQGVMDPEMHAEMQHARGCIKAEYYNTVPAWLVENLPSKVMLMPNGDVVTYGALGSYSESSISGCCGNWTTLYRYDAEGELVRTTNNFWWWLYFDKMKYDIPAGGLRNRSDGYIYFVDEENDEILSVWDWDGTPLDTAILPPTRDRHPFMINTAPQIQRMYDAQTEISH